MNPQRKNGKQYVETSVEFKAVGNTTNAVTGGWSQIKTVAKNAIVASIYTKP